jgi:phosphate transport system ATP-binding protein
MCSPAKGCPTLAIQGLSLNYHGRPAFTDVSLDISSCAITAIVGPSGCGKSSLLLCLNRLDELIQGATRTGSIQIGGKDIHRERDLIGLRRRVGMIFQRPNPFPVSIRRNLDIPLAEHGFGDRKQRAHIIEKTLSAVGLWPEVRDRLDAPAQTLSGGQQQRLCIARALVLDPEILVFDEPCSALDPVASAVVEELIADLRGRYTVIMVTHNLAQARRLADHLAVFWHDGMCGRLMETGTTDDLFSAPSHPVTMAYLCGARG